MRSPFACGTLPSSARRIEMRNIFYIIGVVVVVIVVLSLVGIV